MNFKQMILPLGLALATTWAIQYFVINRFMGPGTAVSTTQSGQTFNAPTGPAEVKPLNKEVDFIDTSESVQGQITVVTTPLADLEFSSAGAVLTKATFKKQRDGHYIHLTTTMPEAGRPHDACFLLALEHETPLAYRLVEHTKDDTQELLKYQSTTAQATIEKTFTIAKATHKIDLELSITPAANMAVEPRLLVTSPLLEHTAKAEHISAVVNGVKSGITKINRGRVDERTGWFAPTLFGSDDRYFVYAMINDPQHFTQRAYYKLEGHYELLSILEGPRITQPTTWQLSFYLGPKDQAALDAVDKRLEGVLDYSGILAPISKFLLNVLTFLYKYLKNYGFAIIALTLLINLILLPFNLKGNASMKKHMEFQKKLAYIQQRYKHDPEALKYERAELIRKHGMPGLGGCLPKLIQLPIFFALSRVLSTSIELYMAPFGWIPDLSSFDPYYILPIVITLLLVVQALMTEPKQRMTMLAVALVFGAVSASLAAGLSLYILMSVGLGVAQQAFSNSSKWSGSHA